MRIRITLTAALALALALACAGVAGAQEPPRSAEVIAESVSANCRYADATPDPSCKTPLSPEVSAAAVEAYQGSWVNRALGLQRDLSDDVPLRNSPFVGTHNSFNSVAEMGPALSVNDSNQQLVLADQLRLDIRAIELDVHRFLRAQDGRPVPVVCHARGGREAHAGCSTEKPLGVVLDEVAAWLRSNPQEVLLLDFEDHLDTVETYDEGAAIVESRLGDLIFRPPGGCESPPLDLTREQIRAAGKQVIVTTGCGGSAAWSALGFDRRAREETRPRAYEDFPSCGPDFDRATYEASVIRYFEDSTGLNAVGSAAGALEDDDGITPATAARMARCGVDLIGLDQLLPEDGRLEALVWSWAPAEPVARRNGDCAIQRSTGRWEARTCRIHRPVACRRPDGSWVVGRRSPSSRAEARCRRLGAVHAAPRTGYEGQLLRVAMESAAVDVVLLGLRRVDGRWTPLDVR